VSGFDIGQRALLVHTPNGNVLWDCNSLLDDATVEAIKTLGGISAIAVSHPHTVGSLVEYSHAFDNTPIYWHADNHQWVMQPDSAFVSWAGGADGHGALLTGDTMQAAQDRRYLSFMYSYPNMIPLNKRAIERILNGGWWDYLVTDAKSAVKRSAERYIKAISWKIEALRHYYIHAMPGVVHISLEIPDLRDILRL
jgi:hypothetical protein